MRAYVSVFRFAAPRRVRGRCGAARTWSAASARHGTTAALTYSWKPSKDPIPGVLVVDNSGRPDEACVGDLVALEASRAGLSGIVIWGLHRDTSELHIIRLPVFSLGVVPAGPQRLDPQDSFALSSAACGQHIVTADDF